MKSRDSALASNLLSPHTWGRSGCQYTPSPAREVFEGNIAGIKTLRRILARLALPEAGLKPVVILDAGFASVESLALLR